MATGFTCFWLAKSILSSDKIYKAPVAAAQFILTRIIGPGQSLWPLYFLVSLPSLLISAKCDVGDETKIHWSPLVESNFNSVPLRVHIQFHKLARFQIVYSAGYISRYPQDVKGICYVHSHLWHLWDHTGKRRRECVWGSEIVLLKLGQDFRLVSDFLSQVSCTQLRTSKKVGIKNLNGHMGWPL